MHILVINCGSSSIKADILEPATGRRAVSARVERVGTEASFFTVDGGDPEPLPAPDHQEALNRLLPRLLEAAPDADLHAVGHRVVHGGESFTRPTRIDDDAIRAIEALEPLAPLHNPPNLAGIRAARRHLPHLPHVAVFDTAFHATLPHRARTYALPPDLVRRHHLRRFGFHGSSHAWNTRQAAHYLDLDPRDLRLVSCHLGNGASVTAVEMGRSVDTSMGMTPLEGLVMGTRSGDLDPGLILALLRTGEFDVDDVDHLLNRESGLAGLSGRGHDLRDIERGAEQGDEASRRAIQVFCHRLLKYIGAYVAVLGGVDAVVFSGGIGEHSALIRQRVCQHLHYLGARLDEDANRDARVDPTHPVCCISSPRSRVHLLVVATDEARAIAGAVHEIVRDRDRVASPRPIPLAISARHVHLTPEAVETLFGAGHTLTEHRPLRQPGHFAAQESVTLHGPRRSLPGVRVLGPCRSRCQVEISRTDEFHLGIDAPIRASGDLEGTPGIVLEGPAGRLELEEGVICAWRHIHMPPEDARHFGVEDRDVVEVAIDSQGRDLVFGDVLVRVSEGVLLEMHIDTDEGNAAEIDTGDEAVMTPAWTDTGVTARLNRRSTRVGVGSGSAGS